jgi:hypothetical protein
MNCRTCNKKKACFACAKCKKANYCNAECQRVDWKYHSMQCNSLLFIPQNDADISKAERIKADKLEFLIPRGSGIQNEFLARSVASLLGFRSMDTFRVVDSHYLLDQREFYTTTTSWGESNSVLSMYDSKIMQNKMKEMRKAHYTLLALPCFNALNNDTDGNQFIVFERGLFIHAAPIDREIGTNTSVSTMDVYNSELKRIQEKCKHMNINVPECAWKNARDIFLSRLSKLTESQLGYTMAIRANDMLKVEYNYKDSNTDIDITNHEICEKLSTRYLYERFAPIIFESFFPIPDSYVIIRAIESIARDVISNYKEGNVYDEILRRLSNNGPAKLHFKRNSQGYSIITDKESFVKEKIDDLSNQLKGGRMQIPQVLLEMTETSIRSNRELQEYAIVHNLKDEMLEKMILLLRRANQSFWSIAKDFHKEINE